MSETEPKKQRRDSATRSIMVLFGSVFLIWLSFLLDPLCVMTPFVLGGALFYFVKQRRFVAIAVLVLTTPLSVSFCSGVYDYSQGNAALRYYGLPGTRFHNLDPQLRCGNSTSGCIVFGNEWVTHSPYNGAVRLLTATLGPMPGTYLGSYPTEAEAKQAVADASQISTQDLLSDRLNINGDVIHLDAGVGEQLIESIWKRHNFSSDPDLQITAAIWQRDCVVLRIPSSRPAGDGTPSAAIILLSRNAGRPFAYYAEGDYSHHFPPVRWKRSPTDN